jgi:hypothetical protein
VLVSVVGGRNGGNPCHLGTSQQSHSQEEEEEEEERRLTTMYPQLFGFGKILCCGNLKKGKKQTKFKLLTAG